MLCCIPLAALIGVAALTAGPSEPRLPRGYVCYRADHPPVMDGKLSDPVWKRAPWTADFDDIEGSLQPHPRFRTRAKLLWDDDFLYVGVELEEPHVWATLTEHDSVIFQDNDFELFLDPDGDNHNYYEFEINALNTTWDLRLVKPYRDGGPALNSWEIPGMKSAVHVNGTLNNPGDIDQGWTIELAFPWKVLCEYANRPSPPHDGDQWRIDFSRVEWDVEIIDGKYHKIPDRPEHNWVWSPQGVVDMHRPERWGYLQFSTAAPGSARFRRDPAEPIRDYLMTLYYAQKSFHDANQKWAANPVELKLGPLPNRAGELLLKSNPDGYEASLTFRRPGAPVESWHLRQDSRLWKTP